MLSHTELLPADENKCNKTSDSGQSIYKTLSLKVDRSISLHILKPNTFRALLAIVQTRQFPSYLAPSYLVLSSTVFTRIHTVA